MLKIAALGTRNPPLRGRSSTRIDQQRDIKAMESFLLFAFPSFLPYLCSPRVFLCILYFLHNPTLLILDRRNHELLHRLIQTPCLYLSRSTLLRKTLIADYYLLIDCFFSMMRTWKLTSDVSWCRTFSVVISKPPYLARIGIGWKASWKVYDLGIDS